MSGKGIRVTVTDLETGESDSAEIMDDYVLVVAGTAYVAGSQVHANGTVVVTIKGVAPAPLPEGDQR